MTVLEVEDAMVCWIVCQWRRRLVACKSAKLVMTKVFVEPRILAVAPPSGDKTHNAEHIC